MPATLHDVRSDALPPALAVDTSFLIAALDGSDSNHRLVWPLYERIVRERILVAVCRPLLLLEVRSALKKVATRLKTRDLTALVEEAGERVRGGQLGMWRYRVAPDDDARRQFLLDLGELLLDDMMRTMHLASTRLSRALLDESRAWMVSYGLDSHDAVVLAVAQRVATALDSPPHLASTDQRFARVDGLHVWGC